MSKFELLCVTMHQHDFSKLKEMNIQSDVVFANQSDHTSYEELEFGEYKAKMISTETRGVGINRNFSLMYATADICLFADDDVVYYDGYKDTILTEFDANPDADVFIFHFDSDSDRTLKKYPKTKKCGRLTRMSWGGIRIAFRMKSVKKANICFTTLFGGGCLFPAGEDSMWLLDAKRKGLTFYVSDKTIGKVSFETSTWFNGYDERYFYGKGAFIRAAHPRAYKLWIWYYLFRYRNCGELRFRDKKRWMKNGFKGYQNLMSYKEYVENIEMKQ